VTGNGRSARRLGLAVFVTALLGAGALGLGSASPAAAASTNQLTVQAGEYAYLLHGKPTAGWVTINFENDGVEYHMMVVQKLKPGVTVKQLKVAVGAQDQNAAFGELVNGDPTVYGTPDVLAPGQMVTTVAQLAGGHYGILCFVPAAGDGKPHALHGMITTFDVGVKKSSARPPTDGVQDVTLTDSSIAVPPSGITAHAILKVTNTGTDIHSFTVARINSGQTLDDVKTYFDNFFNTGQTSATPPGMLVGGVSSVKPGGVSYLELDLKPGHYGYVSTGGTPPADDYSKGMKGEFDIK
jgi:hypothetical protein